MSQPTGEAHWPRTLERLLAATERRGGSTYSRADGYVTLIPPDRQSGSVPSIQVSDWGDDGAMIEVDVLIRVLADCQSDPDEPPYAVQLVEGIMDGGATETAHILHNELIELSWSIETPYGGADNLPDLPPGTTHFHRRIPPWDGR